MYTQCWRSFIIPFGLSHSPLSSFALQIISSSNARTEVLTNAGYSIGGTDYSQAEKSTFSLYYVDSVFTAWALQLSASSTTVKGRFACSIASTVNINRRQLGISMFADNTLLNTVSSDTQVSTSSTSLVDDTQATISRTTVDTRELLTNMTST